ncbi:hypothetical protein [Paraconexibacter sp.]|uniref:hypothetical protein n=1 Tax=Paraconexibacter sp. TaxID=2949640 RepID=UPI003568FB99
MSITTRIGVATLVTAVVAAVPTTALARDGGRDRDGENVPSRITSKLRSAERALDRAQERADDGETSRAVSALTSVRKHHASALKSAKRRVAPDTRTGAPSALAVSRAEGRIADGAIGLLDGAGADLTAASLTTLDAVLDGRDDLVSAIAALDTEDQRAYRRVLRSIARTVKGEIEDIGDALTDDELTADGTSGLQDALTQVRATQAAVAALQPTRQSTSDGADYPTSDASEVDGASRPARGRGGRHGRDRDCDESERDPQSDETTDGSQEPISGGSYG